MMAMIYLYITGGLGACCFAVFMVSIAFEILQDSLSDGILDWVIRYSIAGSIIFLVLWAPIAIYVATQNDEAKSNKCTEIGGHYEVIGHYAYMMKGIVYQGDTYGCVKGSK